MQLLGAAKEKPTDGREISCSWCGYQGSCWSGMFLRFCKSLIPKTKGKFGVHDTYAPLMKSYAFNKASGVSFKFQEFRRNNIIVLSCISFFWHYIWNVQENIPLEEVFENLKCNREGLASDEVQKRLDLFGYNKLEEKKVRISMLPFPHISFFLLSYNSCSWIFPPVLIICP